TIVGTTSAANTALVDLVTLVGPAVALSAPPPPTTDPGVFEPGSGTWLLDQSQVDYNPATTTTIHFGAAGDIGVTADWLRAGTKEVGVFRPSTGTWFLDTNNSNYDPAATIQTQFGGNGDIPVVGHWLGGSVTYVGVFRPSTGTWYLDTVMPDPGVPGAYDPT